MSTNFDRDPELNFPESDEDTRRLRRERAIAAGHAMAGEPLDIRAGTLIPKRVLAEQGYTAPEGRLTESERRAIERGSKPGPISRWAGYAIGSIIAVGGVAIVGILVIKGIIWAWSL